MSGLIPHGGMNKTSARSSTPPARRDSPPPVSPTVTHLSSRSHTPSISLADSHDINADLAPRSQSPPRSPSPLKPTSTMGSRPGGPLDHERPSNPQRPSMISSNTAPPGRIPRPLLSQDHSQYSEAYLPTAAVTPSSTSLAELAHLIRLSGFQEQRRSHSRVRLHRWLVSSALSARLVHCGELAHRTLVDNFRADDKKSFATLYNALHDVRNSCDATRRYALLEPDLDFMKQKQGKSERTQSFSTFMHEIPTKIRDELLDFLSEIRTNPDFLATRVTSLSQAELASMTSFRSVMDPIDTVMARQIRGQQLNTVPRPSQTPGPNAVERLLSFQRHDPLAALIYTVFANSSGPDSVEDSRRTDVWAGTCARLVTEGVPGADKFVKSVFDVWTGMREWPGKANLELYLMKVLQDGQFLLDKAEGQSPRPRTGQQEARNTKDTIAADEFYDSAVKQLFEVIDDEPAAGGLPEGFLELGTAFLRKFEGGKHRAKAQFLIVGKWFFSSYLLSSIVHPETQGIMTGHHINEHARQKILKEIGIRASKYALDVMINWNKPSTVLPEIRQHVENIIQRLKFSRNRSKPVLLPAKAITSPRETVEVQPFIVVCPADIVTMVHTLFPERRPQSSGTDIDSLRRGGLASGASSLSGVSMPLRTGPRSSGDASSVLSMSASSMTSENTSREPLLDDPEKTLVGDRYQGPLTVEPTEDYGRRLRLACSEMSRLLGGVDAISGSCHPCAERWAVLYVSPDGKGLRTRMHKDSDDEDEHDDDSPDSDSEDEGQSSIDLEADYHQLKQNIAKLVEEYEIPKELAPESESKGFSNRTSTHRSARAITRTTSEQLQSKNPYLSQSNLTSLIAESRNMASGRQRSPQHQRSSSNDHGDQPHERQPVLLTMLEAAMTQCQARSDFVNAHIYYKTIEQLKRLQSPTLMKNGYAALLNYFSRGPRDSVGKAVSAIAEFEAWFVWLNTSQERHDSTIEDMMVGLKSLRDKMWYITDVRNSARYEEAKSVAIALKMMGQPTKTIDGKPIPIHKPRTFSRSSANNFLLKTESQVVDLIAAQTEFGGPNKLGDDQSEMTAKWIAQYSIENFCKGEERIHRFCLEIDRCVNKLVGEGVMDGPVLWSSELYRRDKDILDSGRQKGDLFLTGVGTLSIARDEEYETNRPGSRSLDFAQRPSMGSLRSISHRNGSQHSFDSSKWSTGRSMDLLDSQDYFGSSNPALTIDTTTTFWSPFQAQAESPSSSTSIRPQTASSSKDTVMLKNSSSVNEDKKRFLLDLKQSLTGLLLSDLGTLVFGHGSETDSWFSGDLGEECIARKEEEERRRKQKLARKKSMKSIRGVKSEQYRNPGGPLEALGRNERASPAAPVATLQHATDHQSGGEQSSSASDATARSSSSAAKRAGLLEFPYNVAFRRLLRKFATHPNPFSKLHALYELEQIIVASLSSRSNRQFNNRQALPTVPQSPTLGSVPELSSREPAVSLQRAANLQEAIANCEERRSHTMNLQPDSGYGTSSPMPRSGAKSPGGPPSTDMIVDVLQGLFRDAEIRPKTLFRDLQYIAAFVPASMLDRSARGKAFWDAGLAALGLKEDVCRVMVEIADEIVVYNTQNRGTQQAMNHTSIVTAGSSGMGSSSSAGGVRTDVSDVPVPRFSMEDAARMLVITAKEGDPVAERELAIFYLTHPDLLQTRTILPLTKPKDVFKAELLNRDRGSKKEDPTRSDPITMCVAQHWMEMSMNGGDELARKYLRQREDMERIS